MYEDDDFNEDFLPIEDLLEKYENVKEGSAIGMMDEDDFERVIEYFYQNSNDAEALLASEIACTYYPYSIGVLLLKTEILLQTQKYGQAHVTLDHLESFDLKNLSAVLLRSEIYINQSRYEQAAQFLESRCEDFSNKEKIEILLELSNIYDECEAYDKVYAVLKQILLLNPKNEEALQKISFWAEFSNQLEDAIQLHEHITMEDPYSVLAWFNLGACNQSLKRYDAALEAYKFCLAIDEKFEFAYRNMADAYMRNKQYNEALEVLQKHLEIGKPEDVIFEAMGYCHEKQKNYSLARHYYTQASKLNPEDDVIFYKIGETYAREQDWEKAMKSYTSALNLDKENPNYFLAIGNCLMELNLANEALLCFLNAVTIKPSSKTVWIALLRALVINGQYDEALHQVEAARENCGDKPEFDFLQAAILFEVGKSKEALLFLEEGLMANVNKLRLFTQLNPDYMKRTAVIDIISKYKRKK
jgi:tetratricopeptide (TPR) repeat protein